MGEVKTQFGDVKQGTSSDYTRGNYLLDSLSFAAADPRKPSTESAALLSSMKAYVNGNPGESNVEKFNGYVAKVTSHASAETKPTASLRTKPGTGFMG
jgi:hypothetical protein